MRGRRGVRRAPLALMAACLLALACASSPDRPPHPALGDIWRAYRKLPPKRALAIAGSLDGFWVGAVAGGAYAQVDANAAALAECRRKRHQRRMQAPCLLYAVGSEIVWQGP